jgi:phenylalanyl-tRNA synthetase beta chain
VKITLNWLKQYVDFPWTPEELRERLTMIGIEVEGMQTIVGEFEGVVVAQILASLQHPNADKLSVCRVADGAGERQIVCGAKNYKVGDKVPLALPGCALPTPPGAPPFVIKVGKLRGVESQGMMCSAKELRISEDAEGLLILPADAKVGQPLAEHLGRSAGDVVYDLEITPNRPDLNSLIGIAREISALTGNPLRLPEANPAESDDIGETAESVGVRLDDPDLCPRYTARLVRGAKVAPSPEWLKGSLEKVGIRGINNIVDVTNYVMLEIGQPLHAFDFTLLATAPGQTKPAIVVRRAALDETFVTLDGQTRKLGANNLLIADETRGIALAGVMGGKNSEIGDQTADVLIESAYFKPQNIRATSKQLDLRTDASYRFERGGDVEICDWASRRAAQLILQTAGGKLARGAVDAHPAPTTRKEITLRHRKTSELLGVEIPAAQQDQFLSRLGLEIIQTAGADRETSSTFRIPAFRVDLKREADLIEEVVRLHGIDNIPASAPRGVVGSNPFDSLFDQIGEARQLLSALGLNEAQGQTLITDATARLALPPPGEIVLLANPLSSEMNALRPSLLPGLLDSLRCNAARREHDVRLFEIGRAFSQTDSLTKEERRVAFAITGNRETDFWSGDQRGQKCDIYDLKGLLEEFLERSGLRGYSVTARPSGGPLYLESAAIQLGKQTLGEFGQLLPSLARNYDLRDAVFLAELNLDLVLARRNRAKSFKPLPSFPSVRRDLAMVVPEATSHDSVLAAARQAKSPILESIDVFDVFRGKNAPAGQKSVAYSFIYRHSERTLTDAEVNAELQKVTTRLQTVLGAQIRDA